MLNLWFRDLNGPFLRPRKRPLKGANLGKYPTCSNNHKMTTYLGVVHKLRLQDEVGRWFKNVHF